MKVAFQGWKKLSYQGPDGSGTCTFNYSKDKEVQGLGESLVAVARAIVEGARLEICCSTTGWGWIRRRSTWWKRPRWAGAADLHDSGILERLADDQEVMERVRKRARKLLARADSRFMRRKSEIRVTLQGRTLSNRRIGSPSGGDREGTGSDREVEDERNRRIARGAAGKGFDGSWGSVVLGLAAWRAGMAGLTPAVRADDAGQPARAVRLSSVDGQVQLSQGNHVVAEAAVANTPLFEGTRVTTADDGRAEIQFEDGSVARLSPNSALTLNGLRGAGRTAKREMTLNGGLGYFEMQGGGQAGTIRVQFGGQPGYGERLHRAARSTWTPAGGAGGFLRQRAPGARHALTVDLHGGESVALNGRIRAGTR